MKLFAYIIPLLLVSFAAQAQQQIDVQMFETGENTLTANWNGQALTTTLIGPETWDVNLASAGHVLDGSRTGEQISWFEPDNALFNVVTVASLTDLTFQSEVPFAGIGPFPLGTSFFIGTDPNSNQEAFAQVFDQTAHVPDGGSTLGLISLGLAGLGLLKSKFKSARK
jgi:hypothetical protein